MTTQINMVLPSESTKQEQEVMQNGNNVIQETLSNIEKECLNLLDVLKKKEIPEDELEKLNEKVSKIGKVFNDCLNEMLSLDLDNKEIFLQSMKAQGFISRLAHKIQKRRYVNNEKKFMNKIKKEKHKLENMNEKIVDETSKLKENVLTITSLVFMAFTFIQINFIAFQGSKDYLVFDRLILFSGINIFLILGIYTVFSMIKSIINKNESEMCGLLKKRISYPMMILIIIFLTTMTYKFYLESKPKYEEEKNYVEYLLTIKKEKLQEIEENVINLKEESIILSREIKQRRNEIDNLNSIMRMVKNEVKKTVDNEILGYEDRIAKLEEKIVMLETENNNLKSIKLAKKEEADEKILIEKEDKSS